MLTNKGKTIIIKFIMFILFLPAFVYIESLSHELILLEGKSWGDLPLEIQIVILKKMDSDNLQSFFDTFTKKSVYRPMVASSLEDLIARLTYAPANSIQDMRIALAGGRMFGPEAQVFQDLFYIQNHTFNTAIPQYYEEIIRNYYVVLVNGMRSGFVEIQPADSISTIVNKVIRNLEVHRTIHNKLNETIWLLYKEIYGVDISGGIENIHWMDITPTFYLRTLYGLEEFNNDAFRQIQAHVNEITREPEYNNPTHSFVKYCFMGIFFGVTVYIGLN